MLYLQKKPDLCVLMMLKLQQYKYGTNDLQKSLATYIFLLFYSQNRNKPGLTKLVFHILS